MIIKYYDEDHNEIKIDVGDIIEIETSSGRSGVRLDMREYGKSLQVTMMSPNPTTPILSWGSGNSFAITAVNRGGFLS
jgi:hypothetical protein